MAGLELAAIWFVMWMLTWPAILADFQSIGDCNSAKEDARHDLGFAMSLALLPPIWFLVPFVTGFYEHGMQFGLTRKDCDHG